MVDHKQKFRSGRIMTYVKEDLVPRSFGRVALIVYILTATMKR